MPVKHVGYDPPSGYNIDLPPSSKPATFNPLWDNNGSWKFALQVPGLSTYKEIHDDFIRYGRSEEHTKSLMEQPEPVVDGFGQPPNWGEGFPTDDEGRWNLEMVPREYKPANLTGFYREANRVNKHKDAKKPPAGYRSLQLNPAWKNWVLFDPDSEHWLWPKGHDRNDMPMKWMDWLVYLPGNTHIIAYNEASQAFKLQRVRKSFGFEGKRVVYGDYGPRLEWLVRPEDIPEVVEPAVAKKGGKKSVKKGAPSTRKASTVKAATVKAATVAENDNSGQATAEAGTIVGRRTLRSRKASQKAKDAVANVEAEAQAQAEAEEQAEQSVRAQQRAAARDSQLMPPPPLPKHILKRKNEEVEDTKSTASKRPKRGV